MKTINDVTRELTAITKLAETLLTEAVHRANDSLMPGGLAMVSLAHVANREAFANHIDTLERIQLNTGIDQHAGEDEDNWEPPLQTLCFWSEQWRKANGAEYGKQPTLHTEASFIRWSLNWAWDNEPRWDDFATDMTNVRLRLEDMLSEGERVIRSEIVCLACDTKLVRRMTEKDGYEDEWYCYGCHRPLTGPEYGLAKADAARREMLND